MKTFENDRYPRGEDFRGTKESLYDAGRILQNMAEGLDDFSPEGIETMMKSVRALIENAQYDEKVPTIKPL